MDIDEGKFGCSAEHCAVIEYIGQRMETVVRTIDGDKNFHWKSLSYVGLSWHITRHGLLIFISPLPERAVLDMHHQDIPSQLSTVFASFNMAKLLNPAPVLDFSMKTSERVEEYKWSLTLRFLTAAANTRVQITNDC